GDREPGCQTRLRHRATSGRSGCVRLPRNAALVNRTRKARLLFQEFVARQVQSCTMRGTDGTGSRGGMGSMGSADRNTPTSSVPPFPHFPSSPYLPLHPKRPGLALALLLAFLFLLATAAAEVIAAVFRARVGVDVRPTGVARARVEFRVVQLRRNGRA